MKALSGGRSPRLSPPAGSGQAAFASTELHTFDAHRLAYGCAGQVIVPHDTMPANDGANGFAGQFHAGARKSGVLGKSVSVRVNLGCRRSMKIKRTTIHYKLTQT